MAKDARTGTSVLTIRVSTEARVSTETTQRDTRASVLPVTRAPTVSSCRQGQIFWLVLCLQIGCIVDLCLQIWYCLQVIYFSCKCSNYHMLQVICNIVIISISQSKLQIDLFHVISHTEIIYISHQPNNYQQIERKITEYLPCLCRKLRFWDWVWGP